MNDLFFLRQNDELHISGKLELGDAESLGMQQARAQALGSKMAAGLPKTSVP